MSRQRETDVEPEERRTEREPIRVLLADDHQGMRAGLLRLLSSKKGIDVVAEASEGLETLALIRAVSPRIAIVDLSMPGLTGLELARILRREGLTTRLVLLSMFKGADVVTEALELGVSGYVLKDRAFEDLVPAVEHVAAGGVFVSPILEAARFAEENGERDDTPPTGAADPSRGSD